MTSTLYGKRRKMIVGAFPYLLPINHQLSRLYNHLSLHKPLHSVQIHMELIDYQTPQLSLAQMKTRTIKWLQAPHWCALQNICKEETNWQRFYLLKPLEKTSHHSWKTTYFGQSLLKKKKTNLNKRNDQPVRRPLVLTSVKWIELKKKNIDENQKK